MQQELLIEFLCEEIPARFQKKAISDAALIFKNILNSYGAIFFELKTLISPRRITILVNRLQQRTKSLSEERRGPKVSAPQIAIDGFLKDNNMNSDDLISRGEYYYLNIHVEGTEIIEIIPDMIEDFIKKMPWPKSMRWYLEKQKTLSAFWVRPIRSIMCIYDETPVQAFIESVGLDTCDYTFGHRFLSSEPIRIFDFEDYAYKLAKNYVMLDYKKKKHFIDIEMAKAAAMMGLCPQYDEELLDEVTGLVEYPFIHIGSIDEKFMSLPQEVLSTSMKIHQKYFTLIYPNSMIAPFFGTMTTVPGTSAMYAGLDRVLRARLSDAMFFYNEDKDVTLEAFAQRLSSIVFHEKLGSMSQKVDRMMSIANSKHEHRAVALCKADLLTQMVGEFPELQGVMGAIYAKIQQEEKDVYIAIREHYSPMGGNDDVPDSYTGARVAFFDKLDTLVGFIGIGIYPTGSKDPFALRRAAFSIVMLLCDFEEDILENESLTWYIETLIGSYLEQGIALEQNTLEKVKSFIIDRLKVYMIEKKKIDAKVVESVIRSYSVEAIDCSKALSKAVKLNKLSVIPGFDIIKTAYKRADGIISDKMSSINLNNVSFTNENMNELLSYVLESIDKQDTEEFLEVIIKTSQCVLDTCDNVLINDSDENIKKKNISVLVAYSNLITKNFGEISLL